jgi:hypothetical protein
MLISKISIPEPCPESWENMHQTQKGKFCDLCSKEVIDFTKWTDTEIINYFENKQATTNKTCGRLSEQQIERINQILHNHTNQQPNLWRIFAWAFSASALSSIVAIQNINAAEKPINQELIENFANKNEDNTNAEINEKDSLKQSWVISGTVKAASDSTPLPGVTVMIKGTNIGTVTDIEGGYKLDISKFASQEEVTLVAFYVGMKTHEQQIVPTDTNFDIEMLEGEYEFVGELVVGYSNPIKRIWWKTKNFFRRIF